ncbi:hypothetical protein HDU93_001707 [Gonapodya sp. JEL0774]|nr:hypothetical protein HDU93_001707 [Gonapodya sp. JEL0774]
MRFPALLAGRRQVFALWAVVVGAGAALAASTDTDGIEVVAVYEGAGCVGLPLALHIRYAGNRLRDDGQPCLPSIADAQCSSGLLSLAYLAPGELLGDAKVEADAARLTDSGASNRVACVRPQSIRELIASLARLANVPTPTRPYSALFTYLPETPPSPLEMVSDEDFVPSTILPECHHSRLVSASIHLADDACHPYFATIDGGKALRASGYIRNSAQDGWDVYADKPCDGAAFVKGGKHEFGTCVEASVVGLGGPNLFVMHKM